MMRERTAYVVFLLWLAVAVASGWYLWTALP